MSAEAYRWLEERAMDLLRLGRYASRYHRWVEVSEDHQEPCRFCEYGALRKATYICEWDKELIYEPVDGGGAVWWRLNPKTGEVIDDGVSLDADFGSVDSCVV